MSAPVKRKLEDDQQDISAKRRSLEPEQSEAVPSAAVSSAPEENSSLQDEQSTTTAEKRKCEEESSEAEGEAVVLIKKVRQPVSSSYLELAEDGRSACGGEEGVLPPLALKPCAGDGDKTAGSSDLRCMQELVEGPHFDSILAKTLLAARQADRRSAAVDSGEAATERCKDVKLNNNNNSSPRVVVEHQPVLPAIYELGQMLTMRGQFDCVDEEGEEEEEEEDVVDSESEDEEEDDESSMFDTPPKHHFDRFWPAVTTSSCGPPPPSAVVVVSSASSHTSGLLTPPASPQSLSSSTTTTTTTYQFLDQTSQRIECDENGKSYLQLGTVSHHHHHHLPVTPVIQPKPLVNLSHNQRRNPPLLPSCRPLLPRPPNPTPPCDHHHHHQHASVGGLFSFQRRSHQPQRRCSPCYRQQRSDMLSLSLHKLHAARQRSDSSLRRSVLICNMLRYIEDESTTEQREEQEAAAAAAAQQLSYHHHHNSSLHHQEQVAEQQQQQQQQSYWSNQVGGLTGFVAPPTPNPYRESAGGGEPTGCGGSFPSGDNNVISSSFDAPLKDFNSAFRQTPIPSPTTPLSVGGGGLQQQEVGSEEEERGGINWSSVLSLSSQAELDPLNNNTYTDNSPLHHHHHQGLWGTAGSLSAVGTDMSDMDLSQHSFDDISWKLSPISADEVLKAFPDENLFQCAA